MSKELKTSEIVRKLFEIIKANTGLSKAEFLYPERDPFLKGLQEVCEFIRAHLDMPVTIVGDYDADGITASLIMRWLFLELTGKEPRVRIPRRYSEGYGLSEKIIDEIDEGLVVTVDNGITALDAIRKAKEKGLFVVVTDHHMARDDGLLPEADVLMDPNAVEGSEFSGYCGAGLAYRIFRELCPDSPNLDKMTAFAAIGTVADVMDLLHDNRNIVINGLRMMKQKHVTFGLSILLEKLRLSEPQAGDIGFKIGPVINASGRLYDDGPMDVFRLLNADISWLEPDFDRKKEELSLLADELIQRNEKRKEMVEEALVKVEKDLDPKDLPVVVNQSGISEGIVGLIAGQLAQKYRCPAMVFTEAEIKSVLKGSGRSHGTFNLKYLLDRCKDVFIGYGGHAAAAGMSVYADNFDLMKQRLSEEIADIGYIRPSGEPQAYDMVIRCEDVPAVLKALEIAAPYGQGNPEPVFKIPDFQAEPIGDDLYRIMGAKQNVLKMRSGNVSALFFDKVTAWVAMGKPVRLDLIGTLSWNRFMGKCEPQIDVLAFTLPEKETTVVTEALEECYGKEVTE